MRDDLDKALDMCLKIVYINNRGGNMYKFKNEKYHEFIYQMNTRELSINKIANSIDYSRQWLSSVLKGETKVKRIMARELSSLVGRDIDYYFEKI